MRIILKTGILAFAFDTEENLQAFAEWRAVYGGHVFAFEADSDRGGSFHDLGPREDACREPINITFSRKNEQFRLISNLAPSPFVLNGKLYASVEGFWQSMKFPEGDRRQAVTQLWGDDAKRAGAKAPPIGQVSLAGQVYPVGGSEHRDLILRACRAKFDANPPARAALLATGDRPLTHKVRHDSKTIPGVVLAEMWMRIRRELRDRADDVAAQAP